MGAHRVDRDTLIRAREKARTAAEIIAIEARIAWANNHNGEEDCPEDRIPTPAEIASWLPDFPREARTEADTRLAQVVETDLVNPHWSDERRWTLSSMGTGRPAKTVLVAAGFVAAGPEGEVSLTLRTIELPAVHEAWQAIPEGERPRHPLAPLVEAWQAGQPIEVKRDTKNNAIMPAPFAIVRDLQSEQGALFDISSTSQPGFHAAAQGWLPTMEPEAKETVESLPLILFDAAGGTSMAPGRGAPLALRLWVESILSVPCPRLPGQARVACTLEELISQLWPNGWSGPGRDALKLERAFSQIQQAYVPWEGGRWLAVAVRNRPDYHNLKSPVVFDVSLPPGSGQGPLVHRPTLRKYGVKNAAAYRLALGLAYLWNKHLTHKGKRLPPTVPVVERNPAGVVLDVHGRPLQRSGRPVTHWSDRGAARTGNYERNPEMERLPWLTPDNLLSLGSPYQAGGRPLGEAARRKALERVRQAADEMVKAGDVAIEKKERLIRLAPPDWWGNPEGKV